MKILKKSMIGLLLIQLSLLNAMGQDCDPVLNNGVFNTTLINSSNDVSSAFFEYIYSQDWSTHQQAIDAGISVGTVVFGVPLQVGGTFTKQQKDEWRSTHQQYKNENKTSSQKYNAIMKFASPEILDAWQTCVLNNASSRVGLYGWIQEVSASSAILHITWIPMAGDVGEAPKVTGSSISGGFRSDNPNGSVLPNQFILLQGASGNLVSVARRSNEDLVIVINTSRGDISCFLKAFPKPSILNFSATSTQINSGESTTLSWTTSRATQITIDNGIENVQASSSVNVSPQSTTTYKLTASNSSGSVSQFVTINVTPPPPVLIGGSVSFHVTNDDKDGDTRVSVFIKSGGNTVAQWSGTEGHWDDNSDHGPFGFQVINQIRKEQLVGPGQAVLIESPNGNDEWHFNWSVTLNFSDGSTKRYDWGGGNVDSDRNTLTNPLP